MNNRGKEVDVRNKQDKAFRIDYLIKFEGLTPEKLRQAKRKGFNRNITLGVPNRFAVLVYLSAKQGQDKQLAERILLEKEAKELGWLLKEYRLLNPVVVARERYEL